MLVEFKFDERVFICDAKDVVVTSIGKDDKYGYCVELSTRTNNRAKYFTKYEEAYAFAQELKKIWQEGLEASKGPWMQEQVPIPSEISNEI